MFQKRTFVSAEIAVNLRKKFPWGSVRELPEDDNCHSLARGVPTRKISKFHTYLTAVFDSGMLRYFAAFLKCVLNNGNDSGMLKKQVMQLFFLLIKMRIHTPLKE